MISPLRVYLKVSITPGVELQLIGAVVPKGIVASGPLCVQGKADV